MEGLPVLVVEDDLEIAELLKVSFRKEGWPCVHVDSGEKALEAVRAGSFSVCVLDLMLPGRDGFSVLRALKASAATASLPVIIASAKGEDADIVAGLELGADDYIAKPFSPSVLVARMRALARRLETGTERSGAERDGPAESAILEAPGLVLDVARHEVRAFGEPVALSATEFAILELLMREPGRVFTRTQAIALTRGEDYPVTDRSLDVHILSLRRKLGKAGALIETVRGIGYRLKGA